MLAMMAVIVDYMFKMCFLLSVFYSQGPQMSQDFGVTYPPHFYS